MGQVVFLAMFFLLEGDRSNPAASQMAGMIPCHRGERASPLALLGRSLSSLASPPKRLDWYNGEVAIRFSCSSEHEAAAFATLVDRPLRRAPSADDPGRDGGARLGRCRCRLRHRRRLYRSPKLRDGHPG